MGIFDRWLKRERPLRFALPCQPCAASAPGIADWIVDKAIDLGETGLDYGPASIHDVDRIITSFHHPGLTLGETWPETLGAVLGFGCYVGEVMVRHDRGTWQDVDDTNLTDQLKACFPYPLVQLPNGNLPNPIGKALKLLEMGEGECLEPFYWWVTGPLAPASGTPARHFSEDTRSPI